MLHGSRPPEALAQYPGFLMNWIATRSRTGFVTGLAELGLHPREFATLTIVGEQPGLTQQDLAGAAGIDASTLVATLDALEQRGLAERRVLPEDRRKRAIHLTPAGARALDDGRTLARSMVDELLAPLSEAEARRFVVLLRKLAGIA